MKKFVLFAAAGMLATATLVYATVDKKVTKETSKKESVKKEVKAKKKTCTRSYHCIF